MNKIILMGRLTRDPDIRSRQDEEGTTHTTARYTLAVDRTGAKKDGQATADFINCVAFGNAAVFCEKYCNKGTKLLITGRLQTGSYTNREGQKVYTTDIIIEQQEFAESKRTAAANGVDTNVYTPMEERDGFMNIPDGVEDEGLPFN